MKTDTTTATELVQRELASAGIPATVEARQYPEECIFIVKVDRESVDRAIELASRLDQLLAEAQVKAFVAIRPRETSEGTAKSPGDGRGVAKAATSDLVNLLTARSRSSEIQPPLEYVKDASSNLAAVLTPRNHLVFGRRGAGKTTLLVEARRYLEQQGNASVWMNVQTHRHSAAHLVFLWVMLGLLERLQTFLGQRTPRILAELSETASHVQTLLARDHLERRDALKLVPMCQRLLRRFVDTTGARVFVFLDDLHYLPKEEQPKLLDLVHGVTRDIDAWLKVACIKHLSRWFEHDPPVGLQTGHDADHIELDLTLEAPAEAKAFLDKMLDVYARHAGIASARSVVSDGALDRLVLASGAVPRDYLVLAAGALKHALRRQNARQAGVQDVNRAAGDQSKVKISELEDDAASSGKSATHAILKALATVRTFCLEEKRFTYFKIDFRDKEQQPRAYGLIQELLDVRILHLVASSLSDKHEAGRRAEVFMLDLSQFSGQRLKKHLHVLEFVGSYIVLRETTSTKPERRGDTSSKLLELLRRGPTFELKQLSEGGAVQAGAAA